MKIIFLLKSILANIVYRSFAPVIKPENQEQAEALYDLTYNVLYDPLNMKGKS